MPSTLLGRGGRGVCVLALRDDGRVAGLLSVTLATATWARILQDAAASRTYGAGLGSVQICQRKLAPPRVSVARHGLLAVRDRRRT